MRDSRSMVVVVIVETLRNGKRKVFVRNIDVFRRNRSS